MTRVVNSTPEFVKNVYQQMEERLKIVRERLGRPLNYTEKLLYGHLADPKNAELQTGQSYIEVLPDRIAFQDATAQMAILQFMLAGKDEPAVPVSVHCDHLIRAHSGAKEDLSVANSENKEVYDFLKSSSQKYGFGFWKPGSGIIHQVVLEQYAFPGLMMLGTDSHTPNAGGLGAFASGVGGADAVDVMVGMPWEVLHPKVVGVHLTGSMSGWTAPKDVIIKLLEKLTCAGGTNRVIEYFGEGTKSISCTGKATICNMGAELGATTSVFPFDERMVTYMDVTERMDVAAICREHAELLQADEEVLHNPADYYEMVIEINLDELKPQVTGPHSPDRTSSVTNMRSHMVDGGWPTNISSALIGSCTNSSYEDIGRVAAMCDQVIENGAKLKTQLWVTPGSEQVRATIERDGLLAKLEKVGAIVLTNACGPCIGQWQRDDIKTGEANSIISSYNRNFPKRNDGNPETCSFIGSPETTFAYALHGRLDLDPFETPIEGENGTFTLAVPENVEEVPLHGFVPDEEGFLPAPPTGEGVTVEVAPNSERLELLTPFDKWDGQDKEDMLVLLKAKGKCTTDHISPAGPWLKYRGHLSNISNNMFNGAINAFTGEAGHGINQLTGERQPFNEIAISYRDSGKPWVAIGDSNYGEGSSREHAAMCPRYMGANAIITRSFARIHETNLKKQGVLPLTFVNPSDYEVIEASDTISLHDLAHLSPGKNVKATIKHSDGSSMDIELKHSMNADQIEWFKNGSALNTLRAQQ
jgi:aconitate hydratase